MNIDKKIQLFRDLKRSTGSHSPSRVDIIQTLGYDPVEYDFCFLSNPYATDLVVERFTNVIASRGLFEMFESYPAGSSVVSSHIANFEGALPGNICVGNGAIQCIEWVCLGWGLNRLLVPIPTFSTYYEFLGERAIKSKEIWLQDGDYVDRLVSEMDRHLCDSLLLILPNNPTGEALTVEELDRLASKLGSRKLVIDESFAHFLEYYEQFRDWRNRCRSRNIVFVKSMSKDFGIAGIRLGYLTTSDPVLKEYASRRSTWNLNNFAVEFSTFLSDPKFAAAYHDARRRYLDVRKEFFMKLKSISSLDVWDSQANFFLIKLPGGTPDDFVFRLLLEHGIYVRTMEDKVGLDGSFIRVACRRPTENQLLLEQLSLQLQ